MDIVIVISLITLICSVIIAWNNYFGLRDNLKGYLRKRLEIPTEEELLKKELKENDRKLYKKITSYLDSDRNMMRLRENDFGATFRDDLTENINNFIWDCKKPEFEFHDPQVEKAKKELKEKLNIFSSLIAKYTFSNKLNTEFRSVPKDWRHRHPDKYNEVVREINKSADSAIEAYDAFIRECRKKLAV